MPRRLLALIPIAVAAIFLLVLVFAGPTAAVSPPLGERPSEARDLPALAPSAVVTGRSANVGFVGQLGGQISGVAVQGDYAYLGVGPRVVVLDVSRPTTPTVVGQSQPFDGIVESVAVTASRAYVAAGSAGLRILDVSNPSNPGDLGGLSGPDVATTVAVSGTYAYLGHRAGGLRVVDVSDPRRPAQVGSYENITQTSRIVLAGRLAYVVDQLTFASSRLHILDVSNPSVPKRASTLDIPVTGLAIDGQFGYAVSGRTLTTLDLIDPTRPITLATTSIQSASTPYQSISLMDVAVRGPTLYAVGSHSCCKLTPGTFGIVQTFVITNPAAPVAGIRGNLRAIADRVLLSGRYAFAAAPSYGLRVVDLTDGTALADIGGYQTVAPPIGLALAGDYVYAALGSSGLGVIAVGDSSRPALVTATLPLDNWSSVTRISIGRTPPRVTAFVVDGGNGVGALDLSRADVPSTRFTAGIPWGAHDVAAAGDTACVVGATAVTILPLALRGRWANSPQPPGGDVIAVELPYAFTAGIWPDQQPVLRVFDVASPDRATLVGTAALPEPARGVAVAGRHVYVADGTSGLRIFDVSNPASPVEVGASDTPGAATGVTISGRFAYVADGSAGLRVVDVSDPAKPVEVGYYDTPGTAVAAAAACGYVYVADSEGGLVILRFTGAEQPNAGAGISPTAIGVTRSLPFTVHLPVVPFGWCTA